jgi:hypothetical protein
VTETTTPVPVELRGGEMLTWTDHPDPGAGALAELVPRLVRAAHPSGAGAPRVLLAGPHPAGVVQTAADQGAVVTYLTRGYPDAAGPAASVGPAGRVLAGGVAALPDGADFDLVVAGGGLPEIASVEDAPPSWSAVLARLVAALRPGGLLLVRLDNPLGLHRHVAAEPWYADRSDPAWTIPGGPLDTPHHPQWTSCGSG